MFIKIDTRNDVKILGLGIAIGASLAFKRLGRYHRRVVSQYKQADRVKTDLINWVTDNCDHLDEPEMRDKFIVQKKFLNIVLK